MQHDLSGTSDTQNTSNAHVDHLLSAYLDRELGGQDTTLVETHLAGCLRCQQQVTEMQALDARLRRLRDSGQPAQLAPLIMHELGVEHGAGGRISSSETARQMREGQANTKLVWLMRVASGALIFAIIAILGLFVMARVRELPQAPLPEATIETTVFEGSDVIFRLNATSYQGIRDLRLTYWYNPAKKISQGFHYETPQDEIEMDYHAINQASGESPWLGRALFYQWTLIEKSGRETTLPLRYDVYTGNLAAQQWHAITTTDTVIYFTGSSAETISNQYAPLVEHVYTQVVNDLGITPDQPPLIYLIDNTYTPSNMGLGTTDPIRIGVPAISNNRAIQAEIARSLTQLLLAQDGLSNTNNRTGRILGIGLPAYMRDRYLITPDTIYNRILLADSARNDDFYPISELDEFHFTTLAGTNMRIAAFMQYLMETHGPASMTRLMAELRDRYSEDAWSDVYGKSLILLYRQWWDSLAGRAGSAEQSRAAQAPPAYDLTKQEPATLWSDANTGNLVTLLSGPIDWLPDNRLFYHRLITNTFTSVIYDGRQEQIVHLPFSILGYSPDGSTVVYSRFLPTQDGTRNVGQLVAQQLNSGRTVTLASGYTLSNLFWLPTGNIIFTALQPTGLQQVYYIPAATVATELQATVPTSPTIPGLLLPAGALPGNSQILAVSGSGKTLVLLGQVGAQNQLYIVDLAETAKIRLVLDLGDTRIDNPRFSPDEKTLAYTRQDGERSIGLYTLSLASGKVLRQGGAPQQDVYDLWPSWLDNNWLVFSSTRDGGYDLYSVRIVTQEQPDGVKVYRLTTGRAYYLRPVVSLDGKYLVYLSYENQELRMVRVTIDRAKIEQAASD